MRGRKKASGEIPEALSPDFGYESEAEGEAGAPFAGHAGGVAGLNAVVGVEAEAFAKPGIEAGAEAGTVAFGLASDDGVVDGAERGVDGA